MHQLATSIAQLKLPSKYQAKLVEFESKKQTIMTALKKSMPMISLHTINARLWNIRPKQQYLQESKSGIVVCKLFEIKSSRPQDYETSQDWLIYRGTCFLATLDIGICCYNQLNENGKYVIKIIDFNDSSRTYFIDVKEFYRNPLEKDIQGEIKSQDYAFLRVQMTRQQYLILRESLSYTQFAIVNQIEDLTFTFNAHIYQYFDSLPQELQKVNQWKCWTKNQLIQSTGIANYVKQELSYNNSTGDGSSGSPIVIKVKGKCYIAGIHSRGSHFHSRNYGILFKKAFFEFLFKFKEVDQRKDIDTQNYQQFSMKRIRSLKRFVDYKETLRQRLMRISIKQNPSKCLNFIGRVLEKVIDKLAMLERSELIIESLSCSDVIISREKETDFHLDFTRLKLDEFFNKYSQHLNINCLIGLKNEIQALTQYQSFLPKQIPLKISQFDPLENSLQQSSLYLLKSIQRTLRGAVEVKQSGSQLITRVINFLKYEVSYISQDQSNMDEFFMLKGLSLDFKEQSITSRWYNQIALLQDCELNIYDLRQTFILMLQYSRQKLNTFFITKVYLFKISLIVNQIRKVIQFFLELYTNSMKDEKEKNYDYQIKELHKQLESIDSLSILNNLPVYSLLFKDYKKKLNFYNLEKNIEKIKLNYQSLFGYHNINVEKQILFSLATNEFIFNELYYHRFQLLIKDLKNKFYDEGKTLFLLYLQKNQEKGRQLLENTIKCQDLPLRKKKAPRKDMSFNIFEMKIFKQIFIDYQHNSFNRHVYDLMEVKKEQQKDYQDIISILVSIQNSQKKTVGNGFFLNKTTVCTARHIFAGKLDQQDLQTFRIVNKDRQIIGQIHRAVYLKTDNILHDLIFLDVRIYEYSGTHKKKFQAKTKNNVFMIDYDQGCEKFFTGIKYYALMMGFREYERQLKLIKSFGQVQIKKEYCHPLVGQNHLSGSPIFLKIPIQNEKQETSYQYAIIGVYIGDRQKSQEGMMAKFKSREFKGENNFELQRITFVKMSDYGSKLKSAFKEYISQIYSSLDHFLLRVLAQILRLNSVNIYLQNLALNNLIMRSSLSMDIVFSNVKVNLLLESPNLSQEMFDNLQAKCDNENKTAFCSLIQQLLSSNSHVYFEKHDNFIKQSLLVDHLSLISAEKTLKDYYLNHLQGKFYFDRENSTLKPCVSHETVVPYYPQQQNSQSLLQRYLKRQPIEYLARLNVCYNILKNVQTPHEDFIQFNRTQQMFAKQFYSDIKRLNTLSQSQEVKKGCYFFANKLIQQAMMSLRPYLQSKSIQSTVLNIISQCETDMDIKNEQLLRKSNLKILISKITRFYNLSQGIKRNFQQKLLFNFDYDYQYVKNWTKITEILELYDTFN